MQNQIYINGRKFATNHENYGVYELKNGAYIQHRGNGQTPKFRDDNHLRRYVQRMLKE